MRAFISTGHFSSSMLVHRSAAIFVRVEGEEAVLAEVDELRKQRDGSQAVEALLGVALQDESEGRGPELDHDLQLHKGLF